MLLENLIPQLPPTLLLTLMYVGGALGTILVAYAIFLEKEHQQDIALALGAALLFIYAAYIRNIFFMISMSGLAIAALTEYARIKTGKHRHTKQNTENRKDYV